MERAQIVHLRRNTKKEQEMVGCLPHENREPCSHACLMLSPCTIRIHPYASSPWRWPSTSSPARCVCDDHLPSVSGTILPSFLPSFLPPSCIFIQRFNEFSSALESCDDQKQIELRCAGLHHAHIYVMIRSKLNCVAQVCMWYMCMYMHTHTHIPHTNTLTRLYVSVCLRM